MHTCMDSHILYTENDLTKRAWKRGRLLELKIENNGVVTSEISIEHGQIEYA
jgi:hypothetical protein